MRSPRSLSTRSQFAAVFSSGRRARNDGLTVWALAHAEPEVRLGMSVGTGAGGAVVRNQMRRRLRAVVRSARLTNLDLVIRAGRQATELTYQELENRLKAAVEGRPEGPRERGQ